MKSMEGKATLDSKTEVIVKDWESQRISDQTQTQPLLLVVVHYHWSAVSSNIRRRIDDDVQVHKKSKSQVSKKFI